MKTGITVDAFMLPGYEVPDALPAEVVNEQTPVTAYKVPPAVWMFLFLLIGYIGLRYVLED